MIRIVVTYGTWVVENQGGFFDIMIGLARKCVRVPTLRKCPETKFVTVGTCRHDRKMMSQTSENTNKRARVLVIMDHDDV